MGELQTGRLIESIRHNVPMQPDSRVYVVDPNDSGFTIQNAIDECVAGNGDIILTMPGGISVTSTVLFNKSGIRVMALSMGTRNPIVNGEYHAIWSTTLTADPVAKISQPCYIEGIGFAGADAGAVFFSGAACLIGGDADASPFGVYMKNCRFPKWGLDNRIGLAIEGSSDVTIDECGFEGVGSALAVGIYVQGATQNLTIRGCHFRQCTAAVQFGAFAGPDTGPHLIMDRNIVEDGLILDSQGNTANAFLTDNYSELVTGSSYDASVATLQGQGIQFAGNHYKE